MNRHIQGIIPALVTAFDARGELEPRLQRALVSRLLTQGVHGLFVGGTTGEFPHLTLEERERLTELVAAEVSSQVPIIVHVGTPRIQDAVRLAQHAARIGVHAVATVPPYYYSYRPPAVLDYVEEIATATDLPCYYYHIPTCTGQAIDGAFLERLREVPNVVGLKYSQPDFSTFKRLKESAGPDFQFFCGVDTMLFPSLMMGAAGGVGSMYNFLTPLFVLVWKAYRRGDYRAAHAAQAEADRIITLLERFPIIAAVKETLRILDLDVGPPRPPLSHLSSSESERLAGALMEAGIWEIEGIARATS
jgi:N-acetylneuraminate lyase